MTKIIVFLASSKLSKQCISLFLLTSLLLLNSCTEKTEISPWTTEIVPVVFSVITPGEEVQVYVGNSYSETSKENFSYSSTKVFCAEKDSSWIELSALPQDSSVFRIEKSLLQIQKGKTYCLKVETSTETLYAQTTIPTEIAEITEGQCIIVSDEAGGSVIGGDYSSNMCALTLTLRFPENKDYGCYLTAFSEVLDFFIFPTTNKYQNSEYILDKGISTFEVDVMTIDPCLKKFLQAEFADSRTFEGGDITYLIGSFGGVLPQFSNIENGIGLFGSFVKNSKIIYVTNK